MDYYLLLGIPQDADGDTIRCAFRTLARRYHPDAGEGSSAERFREIVVAYETLNDPTRRGDYDRLLRNRHAPGPTAQIVEPLRASPAPEPMLRPDSRVVDAARWHNLVDRTPLQAIIDELFRSWDESFFGAPRRRDDRQEDKSWLSSVGIHLASSPTCRIVLIVRSPMPMVAGLDQLAMMKV